MNPGEVTVGMTCFAPLKRGARSRVCTEVKVTWLSKDGFVAGVQPIRGRIPKPEPFAVSRLSRGREE